MTGDDRGDGFELPGSRLHLVVIVWLVVLLVSFAVGGYALGSLVDYESVGNEDDPNVVEAVANFANWHDSTSSGTGNTGNTGNTDGSTHTATGNT